MNLTQTIISILSDSKERKVVYVDKYIEGNKVLIGRIILTKTVTNETYEEATDFYSCDVSYQVDTSDLDLIDNDGQSYNFELDEDEIIEFLNNE